MATALLVVFAAVGCGGDDGGGDASADTTGATEAPDTTLAETTTTLSPEAEVEAAVGAFYAMFERLVQAPSSTDPEIAQTTTGASRQTIEETFDQYAALGQAGQPGPNMGARVLDISVAGNTATAQVCAVDDSVLVETTSGRVINDNVVTRHTEMRLERVDGAWLVAEVWFPSSWDGVTDCA